jgi:hypothetical protein
MILCIYAALATLQNNMLHVKLKLNGDTVYVINKQLIMSIATKTMSFHHHLNYDVTGNSLNY